MKKNKLSIYLIKDGINEISDIFKEDVEVLREFNENKTAYFVPSFIKKPFWLKNFFKIENEPVNLSQANSKVALIVRRIINSHEHLFAITFGFAKNLFKDGVLEEQFGLKIVLNSVQENELRKISKTNIGGNQKQSQEQIPKTGKISEFGFDIDRDLIKSITAKSNEEEFKKAIITGGDIFSVYIEKDIGNIEDFLDFCYLKYNDTSYQEKFDWIDNIKAVQDKLLISELDDALINLINNQQFENVWMAVPDVINWENIKCFKYSGSRDEYEDIYIEDFIQTIEEQPISSLDKFKNKTVNAISTDEESNNIYTWNAKKCLIAEIDYQGNSYCLNNNKWYQVNQDFSQKVNQYYNNIELSSLECIDYNSSLDDNYTEDNYNQDLSESIGGALIHKLEIPYGGGSGNKIEVCDVLTRDKKIIHIKKNSGSSQLSHLFNQGVISGEALLDNFFRNKYNDKLNSSGLSEFIDNDFKSSNYTVTYGIIHKYDTDRPKIPFFSKVAVRYAVKSLQNMGYQVELKNIINISE